MPTVSVQPAVLAWARERASLSPAQLAQKVGVSDVGKVEAWLESGELPLAKLEAIAKKTYVPLGYLFLETPPTETFPMPDYRTKGGEDLTDPSPELIDTIRICAARQDWYRDYLLRSDAVDSLPWREAPRSDDAATIAAHIRDVVGWDAEARSQNRRLDGVISALATRIEEAGVLVMRNGVVENNGHRKLDPNEFRGFALADDIAPLVFVNAADYKSSQMFTLAHELAHVWIGKSSVGRANVLSNHPVERMCNAIAAEFLVPMAEFKEEWNGLDDGVLDRLSRVFKVSRYVILIRAREANFISRTEYQELEEAERSRELPGTSQQSKGGDFKALQAVRLGRAFPRAVMLSAKAGTTLMRDAYSLLGVKKAETYGKLEGHFLGV